MSLNEHIASRLEGIRHVLVAQGRASKPLSPASRGREREVFVDQFLAQVFPPHFRFGSGDITDAAGRKSGQVDLVVELPFAPSLPVPGGAPRLYLAEGVAAVIEVKSDLQSQWDEVARTTALIKQLQPKRIRAMWIGKNPALHIPVLAVGYVGYKTEQGMIDRLEATPQEGRPDVLLVLDPGLLVAENGGDYLAGDGPEAMFWFLARLNWYLTKLITTGFSAEAYDPDSQRTS